MVATKCQMLPAEALLLIYSQYLVWLNALKSVSIWSIKFFLIKLWTTALTSVSSSGL